MTVRGMKPSRSAFLALRHPGRVRSVILGGLGSVPGAVVGGLVLASIETLGISFFGQSSILGAYVLVIAVILWKPAGLVGASTGEGI